MHRSPTFFHTLPQPIKVAATVFVATLLLTTLICCVVDAAAARRTTRVRLQADAPADATGASTPVAVSPTPKKLPSSSLAVLRLPTDRENLFDDAVLTNAFVPTNPEIPATALFGSARTGTDGRARFHKGIDIAPILERTRHGEPTDPVYAIADGSVLYINRVGGNSSYGIHVVLLHDDPIGKVYSLYAHLASVPSTLRAGVPIQQGDVIGILGRTSSATRIPTWKAHLHFEMGLMHSNHFSVWERKTKQTPIRGNGHGWNLLPLDAREFLRAAYSRPASFSALSYIKTLEPACSIALHVSTKPNYFRMYPELWVGPTPDASNSAIVLDLTESGLILAGRLATPDETAQIPTKSPRVAVLHVSPELLGRNGRRLIVKDRGSWRYGSTTSALQWLDILRL